ncbi:FAD-dependent oxidoreductase [Rhodococcus sp. NPDC003318]|uniref:FAD-dependent oxidoreductase n=1 Tax=Rhodococcus sp. NPDC003318 TaxID=3364503 RepID=UPI0036990DE5
MVGGGSVGHGRDDPHARARAFLDEAVRSLHPTLHEQRIVATWSGPIAMTRDGFPIVGRRRDHPAIFHAGGCCGHGIAVSSYNGAYLARWIENGHRNDLTGQLPWIRSTGPWIPSGMLADHVLGRYPRWMSRGARTRMAV